MSEDASARIRFQVIWNRLQSVVDEQASTLMRTAFSPIVRESGDLSAGVFDAEGRMLAQAVTGTPGHVNTMAAAVANFFPHFPHRDMRRGDIYISNDPWLGTGHLNDFVLVQPCFTDTSLVGFVACTSHLVDIGGECMGPDGRDVFDEGLYIPPLKLVDAGVLNLTLVAMVRANSRTPEQAEGDVHALIACCEVGEARLADTMVEFALKDLESVAGYILGVSERGTRALIASLPDGTHEHAMTIDGYDFDVTLRARLVIDAERFTVDFAGSSGFSRHGINVPLNYARAYAVFGIKCAVAPAIPNNAGSLAPFEVDAPADTIVNAPWPLPVNSRHIIGQMLPDLVLGCLHKAIPGRVPAEGASTLWDLPIRGGYTARNGSNATPWAIELVHNGGTGARPFSDGLSATAYPSGVMGSLVEITESVTPLVVWRRELRVDSGGAGRQRGGLGQVIELGSADGAPFRLFGTVDRVRHPARGREGGGAGLCGAIRLSSGAVFMGKGALEVGEGERLLVETPGGGGYGPARQRDPGAVAGDVALGMISRAAAERDYAVRLTADGGVDQEATALLRAAVAHAEGEES